MCYLNNTTAVSFEVKCSLNFNLECIFVKWYDTICVQLYIEVYSSFASIYINPVTTGF